MPTQQGTDAFDHGFDVPADYDEVFTPANVSAITSPLYQGRLNTLQVVSDGSNNAGPRKNISGAPTRGWCGMPFRRDSSPASDTIVMSFTAGAGSSVGRLVVTTGGNMYAFAGGNVGSNEAVSTGAFHWIEAIYDVSASTHTMLWRVDGVDKSSASWSAGAASTLDWVQLVSLSGDGVLTWYSGGYWSWGSAANNTDWLGEPTPPTAPTSLYRVTSSLRW